MKIVIFDGTFNTTTFINRLVKGLIDNNHTIYVLAYNECLKNKITGVNYIPLGSNTDFFRFLIVSFSYSLKSGKVLNYIKLLLKKDKNAIQELNLEYLLKKIKPDIIHLQWLSNINSFEKQIVQNKYKFILSQRGFHVNVRPFVDEENSQYLKKWFPKISGFHSVSNAIKEVSKEIYISSKKIDKVVYSGFDLNKFFFEKKYNKKNSVSILSVGRNHWKKGYVYALKAMEILKKEGIKFRYTIIGVKPSEELLYLINAFNLNDDIKFINKVSQADVYSEMKKYDLFLLPSIEEGIANVCIEAMALGLTVLSTDCGGMEELITQNKNGFIVPKRNPKKIAEKIIEFSKMDSKEIEKIKYSARKKVEEQHNQSKMISDMEELYVSVYERN